MNDKIKVWCVLVPTLMEGKFVRTKHHKEWDKRVRKITGGITIHAPGKGQWINPEDDELVEERIIPVHVACTEKQIENIANLTLEHYR